MQTSLYENHISLEAKMVDFHGWEMPIQYSGIVDEHNAVRNACGLFDVSHMGEIEVKGEGAFDFVQNLITNDVSATKERKAVYSPMCLENGGIVDDLIVYGREYGLMIVINSSNIEKDFNWMKKNSMDAELTNVSEQTSLLALQGPKAKDVIEGLVDATISKLSRMSAIEANFGVHKIFLSRSGYTGEDGFEVYCESKVAPEIWSTIMETGKSHDIKPCGLGARDSLRLEAGLMLYGNDIDENTTPFEAPLKWTVKMEKDFIGKKALIDSEPRKKLFGFELIGKRVPRHGNRVFVDMKEAGIVTSGIYSPTLEKSIGFCSIPPTHPKEKGIQIEIGDKFYDATVCNTRFYKSTN